MARGFKSGGRKPGSKNKRTVELEQKQQAIVETICDAMNVKVFEGDAHTFLMSVYKNPANKIELRVDAAKAALRFEKPQLASIETKSDVTVSYVAELPSVANSTEEWLQQVLPTRQ